MKPPIAAQETAPARTALSAEKPVAVLLLSAHSRAASTVPPGPLAGFGLRFEECPLSGPLPPGLFSAARAIVVEVETAHEASWQRLENILGLGHGVPVAAVIAAATQEDMRRCLRLGAADVLPLPLAVGELAEALEHMARTKANLAPPPRAKGRTAAFLKSVGGVGATALLTQAGCLLAQREQPLGRQVCLLDLDIQFGSAALYLGLAPALSFHDLLRAGNRADEVLLRSVTAVHASGLRVIAAPPEIMPLDVVSAPQMHSLLDIAVREFSTVLIDLPGAWTDWSLSTAARADALCLVTELSVPGLRHARRQIEMLGKAGINTVPLHILANRVERSFWKPISLSTAEQALGHGISCVVGNDFRALCAAINQGVPLKDIGRKSRIERDLAALIEQLLPVEA